jgi:predicted PurR-regulated permease PerM
VTETHPEGPAVAPAAAAEPGRGEHVRTIAVVLIAVTVTFAGLYYGRGVFVPVALSVAFTALLRPVVRWMERIRIPNWLASTLVVLAALALLAGAVVGIAGPVQKWAGNAPQQLKQAQQKLGKFGQLLDPVTRATSGTGSAASVDASGGQGNGEAGARPSGQGGEGAGAQSGGQSGAQEGGGGMQGMASKAFAVTAGFLTTLLEVLLLVWFLLASGDLFVRKLVHVLPLLSEKKRALEVVHETESVVSHYMLASLLMYVVQGAIVALTAWAVGLPTPVLWGALTVVLEFIPYLGGVLMMVLLTLAGLASLDSVGMMLVTPGAYLAVSTIQNNLASPFLYGNRLKLNPVAVLVGVMVWYAMWGIPGAFLAVPIVATVKVMADRIPGLTAIGEFLGE